MYIRDTLRRMVAARYPMSALAQYTASIIGLGATCGYVQVSLSVQGNTRNNLAQNSGMNVDSNADGIVDGFTKRVGSGGTVATFSLNDNAQKISFSNANANNDYLSIRQGNMDDSVKLPCSPNEVVSARVECKFTKTAGSPTASLTLIFRDTAGGNLGLYQSTILNTSTSGYVELKIENKTAPANTAYVSISCSINLSGTASTTPETADAWFKNVDFEKASVITHYIPTGSKSTDCPYRLKSSGKNLDPTQTLPPTAAATNSEQYGGMIKVMPNVRINYTYTANDSHRPVFRVFDENKNQITTGITFAPIGATYSGTRWSITSQLTAGTKNYYLSPDPRICYVQFGISTSSSSNAVIASDRIIHYGDTFIPYEPHTYSEVYTPAIGKRLVNPTTGVTIAVDEFNPITGEKTQRISNDILKTTYNTSLTLTNNQRTRILETKLEGQYPAIDEVVRLIDNASGIQMQQVTAATRDLVENRGKFYVGADGVWLITASSVIPTINHTLTYQLTIPQLTQHPLRVFKNGAGAMYLETFGPNTTVIQEAVATQEAQPVADKITIPTAVPLDTLVACYRNDGGTVWVDVLASASLNPTTGEVTITEADSTKTYFAAVTVKSENSTLATLEISNAVLS